MGCSETCSRPLWWLNSVNVSVWNDDNTIVIGDSRNGLGSVVARGRKQVIQPSDPDLQFGAADGGIEHFDGVHHPQPASGAPQCRFDLQDASRISGGHHVGP